MVATPFLFTPTPILPLLDELDQIRHRIPITYRILVREPVSLVIMYASLLQAVHEENSIGGPPPLPFSHHKTTKNQKLGK